MSNRSSCNRLLAEVRACTLCEPELPLGARPVLQLHPAARILVVGQYAQAWHLGGGRKSVTQRVLDWRLSWPTLIPLPHPSPRNNRWLRNNPWFAAELLPALRVRVTEILHPVQ